MSLHLPFKSLNRSQRVRVGGATLSSAATAAPTYVNIESPRILRDLARHTTLGGVIQAGAPFGFASDGYRTDGGLVSVRATGLVMDVSAAFFVRASGATGTNPADTVTIGAADGTNPRIDLVCIDTNTPDAVVIAGTATANANLYNRLGVTPTAPANRIPIALVLVPPTATNLLQTNVARLL